MKNICSSIAALLSCFFLNAADHYQETADYLDELDSLLLIGNKDFYQYLGVDENATNEEIKRASKELLKNNGYHMIASAQLTKVSSKSNQLTKGNSKLKRTLEELKNLAVDKNVLITYIEKTLLNKSKRKAYDQDLKLYRIQKRREAKQQKKAADRS